MKCHIADHQSHTFLRGLPACLTYLRLHDRTVPRSLILIFRIVAIDENMEQISRLLIKPLRLAARAPLL